MKDLRIGISGWKYAPWRGDFYPPGLPQRRELEYASRQTGSIELNGSFYSFQKPESYRKWYASTPEDFVFAVKGHRSITHIRRLSGVQDLLAGFFSAGVLELQEKLGPVLWQLPPGLAFDPGRIREFLQLLPADTASAASLAGAENFPGRAAPARPAANRIIRHAMEVRHPSFACPAFMELLREYGVALVIADTAGKWPFLEDVTADFLYIRLHGDSKLYESGYSPETLERWAEKIRCWHQGGNPDGARLVSDPAPASEAGRDVFLYFDNTMKGHAPWDALALSKLLGLPAPQPLPEEPRTNRKKTCHG